MMTMFNNAQLNTILVLFSVIAVTVNPGVVTAGGTGIGDAIGSAFGGGSDYSNEEFSSHPNLNRGVVNRNCTSCPRGQPTGYYMQGNNLAEGGGINRVYVDSHGNYFTQGSGTSGSGDSYSPTTYYSPPPPIVCSEYEQYRKLDEGKTELINHDTSELSCYFVNNTSGQDIFIPLNDITEWESFYASTGIASFSIIYATP